MEALREAVRAGRLIPGTALPSSRSLAADLGVARNTVSDAYTELVAEGWLTARQGSGTRVAGSAFAVEPMAPRAPTTARTGRSPARLQYDLVPGAPDPSTFPRLEWLASGRRAMTAAPNDAFGRTDPQGRIELRQQLATYVSRTRGVRADPERIVISAGCSHALELLTGVLNGDVAVESYGLHIHRDLLQDAGLRTVPVPVDEHGVRVEELIGTGAVAALVTPTHQFPNGGPLHPQRRAALIDWARASDALIAEDDYDGEFRYDRKPVGAVQGLDPERVVYLGTVSKSLSPALRLGWMVLPARLVDRVLDVKGEQERFVSAFEQLTLADFLRSGGYDRHIRRMRSRYRRRRDRMVTQLAERAPGVAVTGAAAGLHTVLQLPAGTEEDTVERGRQLGVALDGLGHYLHPDAEPTGTAGLVVSYGTPPEHAFNGALDALCAALPGAVKPRRTGPDRHAVRVPASARVRTRTPAP